MQFWQSGWRQLIIAACLVFMSAGLLSGADDDAERLFENEIRPLLVEKCVKCHGGSKQENGLRLDSRQGLITGGDSGSALKPGDSDASLILQVVRPGGDIEMPPNGKLSDREIAALTRWMQLGAPWPESITPLVSPSEEAARRHWSFQPIENPEIPSVNETTWVRTPIDAFVLAKQESAALPHAPEADRRTLIRRATYAVTGLPPSPEDVDAFVASNDPKAYEELVDKLLDSPQYGEHWARDWLDLARYSDSKGYVYAREERFWVHAWTYRDWVAQALNQDMPYDRFLLLQLAADQVADRDPHDLAAMGFLTIGRRFLGVPWDIIDDRIDAVCRGTMALTVGCARCHDHKYDPIPTADYYSLYGVFESCAERLAPLPRQTPADPAFLEELQKRQTALQQQLSESQAESSERARTRVRDYLIAQTELDKYPAQGFDQIFEKTDMLPAFVRRWESYLYNAKRSGDPIWTPWHAYAAVPAAEFASRTAEVTHKLNADANGNSTINPIVLAAFATPPTSFQDVIDRYAKILSDVHQRWQSRLPQGDAEGISALATGFEDPAAEQLRTVLYGPQAPCEVPHLSITHTETYYDSGTVNTLWKLQGEVDRWIINAPASTPYALTLVDRQVPAEPRILKRGNPLNKGDDVPRQFLAILSGADRKPFEHGSGRLELAEAIIDPANPLTARVAVNRVWAHYFGKGLVTTTSDFGLRSLPPSHPELLDWLASQFISHGWSLKTLHRSILLSATFRQSSSQSADPAAEARARQIDPENRLLSRMNRSRQSFEEFLDSMLAATGQLDRTVGGRAINLLNPPFPHRRALYGQVDRQFLPSTMRVFDFANPDLHTPQRSETTVPQQALFFLNHPLALDRIRLLAAVCSKNASPDETVRNLFERTLQREPTTHELEEALALARYVHDEPRREPPATAADWRYGFGVYDESSQRVADFTPLPHFTGAAWQGGPNWPDTKLGWVQLTADGGHPGNDRQHAAVRRWVAPRAMQVELRSKLIHEPAAGDGIRVFIVSSRAGLLESTKIHQSTLDLPARTLAVEAGETLDFVADIGEVLNSDQYLWRVTLREAGQSDETVTWDSQTDFPHEMVNRLNAWEQLAQILFCTNEFLFID